MKSAWCERSLPYDQLKELESIYSHDLVVGFFDMSFSRADRSPTGNRCIDFPSPKGKSQKVPRFGPHPIRLVYAKRTNLKDLPRVFTSTWAASPKAKALKDERAMEDSSIPGSRPKTLPGSKSFKGIKVYSPTFPSPQPTPALLNSYCLCLSAFAQGICLLSFPPIQNQGPGPGSIRKILPTPLHATRLVTSLDPLSECDLIRLPQICNAADSDHDGELDQEIGAGAIVISPCLLYLTVVC